MQLLRTKFSVRTLRVCENLRVSEEFEESFDQSQVSECSVLVMTMFLPFKSFKDKCQHRSTGLVQVSQTSRLARRAQRNRSPEEAGRWSSC